MCTLLCEINNLHTHGKYNRVFTKPGLWIGLDSGLDYGLTALLNYLGSDQCLSQ